MEFNFTVSVTPIKAFIGAELGKYIKEETTKFCELNNVDFDLKKDRLIRVSIRDHIDSSQFSFETICFKAGLYPAKIFDGYNEGDIVKVKLHGRMFSSSINTEKYISPFREYKIERIIANVNFKLKQNNYQEVEDVLNKYYELPVGEFQDILKLVQQNDFLLLKREGVEK